jgi:NAD-dependent dihydropyrimidine dehydrogenase PreA subunit
MVVTVNQSDCVACGICIKSCPEPGAITRNAAGSDGKRRVSINPALCKTCLLCVSACPKKTIIVKE